MEKYRNTPTERQGKAGLIRFASKKEAGRYDALLLLEQAGEIRSLKLQPEYTLQAAYTTPEGERVRAIRYLADFSYWRRVKDGPDTRWELVVEDVKSRGTRTPAYLLKRKLLLEKHEISVTEV